MTDREAMKMALEALEVATTPLAADRQEVLKAQQALRQALAQPEQEPVCDKDPYYCGYVRCQLGKVCKNTAPPKREWVGLTDEEIDSIFVDYGWCISTLYLRVVRSIEAKLKEKNT